jgi:hypothetical protein
MNKELGFSWMGSGVGQHLKPKNFFKTYFRFLTESVKPQFFEI